MKIIDNKPRNVLAEGRNYGMGFAFLKPLGDDTFETVQPISPCKDYLNDVVYSEYTGKPFRAWGLCTSKCDIFGLDHAFMAISICKMGAYSPGPYGDYVSDLSALKDNLANLVHFINWWDGKFSVTPTSIKEVEPNLYLVKFDKWWTKATYRISLYSLLLRVGMYCKTKVRDPLKFMSEIDNADRMMLNSIKDKISYLLSGKIPVQNMEVMLGLVSVHDAGIQGSSFDHKTIFPSLQ